MALSSGYIKSLTNLRSCRTFAAGLSSVSCQLLSTSEPLLWKQYATEEGFCSPILPSPVFDTVNCTKSARPACQEERRNDFSTTESHRCRISSLCSPCMTVAVIDGSFPQPRSSQFRRSTERHISLSRELGDRRIYSEIYHGHELSSIRLWQNPTRSHMGHTHHDHGGHDRSGKDGERVLGYGLWGDIVLAIGKGAAGLISGSTAIIADAAHSASDIALSAVALWTSKVAHVPKDKQHPYGHGKFETVGALGISGILLLTGGGIAWHAVETLQPFVPVISEWLQMAAGHPHEHVHEDGHHHGIDLQHPYVALSAAIISIGVKERLYWQTLSVGEQQKSELLKASAWHHRSDAISSVVALIGVGGAMLGMPLLDPVAGILVSGMIVKAGLETGYQSLQDLVDSGVQESVLSPIRDTVLHVQGVEGCHHLRGRRMGSFIHVDAHIEVDPWLSVSAAHKIGEAVRHQLHKQHGEVAETFVHIEPSDGGTKTLTPDEIEIEHRHHHDVDSNGHKHGPGRDSNDISFSKKDLTKEGSKSDLMKRSRYSDEGCAAEHFESSMRQHPDVEQDVRHVVGANFHETMTINHVTSHFLQGKVVVEVEVSMNPNISVRNAMDYANDAERAILQRISDISKVHVQLKLSEGLSQSM